MTRRVTEADLNATREKMVGPNATAHAHFRAYYWWGLFGFRRRSWVNWMRFTFEGKRSDACENDYCSEAYGNFSGRRPDEIASMIVREIEKEAKRVKGV